VSRKDATYRSLADYLAPLDSGLTDFVGGFVVTAGLGAQAYADQLREAGDDYSALLVKLLADRLAEAFAEWLHEKIRKEDWGYANDEDLTVAELLKEKYQGIRPAFGYPSLRDHQEKETLFALLDGESIGVSLTDSYMMDPPASVCGLYFGSHEAEYFDVQEIDRDQFDDYLRRIGRTSQELARSLGPLIRFKV
jgi:5-methyltetrahydrofolate--homocysteine methyltransferase